MDLTPYVDDLQHRLVVAAGAGGDDARRLAERLTAPLDAAVRLVLLDVLSAAAGEITAEIAPGSVDVRLRGGAPELVVTPPAATVPAAPPPVVASAPDGDAPDAGSTTRTTLRLPDHLKAQVEVAAARDGISVNTWLVRAVATALESSAAPATQQASSTPRGASRLTGWVR
ncbi:MULTISPECIES: toxin-antitoxin system HicB family antitoxin [unclassified Actinotalea]|uniref:toxin-antitoxin system HicB family antitoxin n=1 Tax=unclassified Actinotalea TaxID=2638618 RepID=UPI0015F47E23|nr:MULTISPECIES: toxin-antitoxin system HicB family antitoxin [unclassified Actinotalea]